jgi:hypothetical protein
MIGLLYVGIARSILPMLLSEVSNDCCVSFLDDFWWREA